MLLSYFWLQVVASIHQPRSSIYAVFDQLYLLSEVRRLSLHGFPLHRFFQLTPLLILSPPQGKVIYDGPAANAANYFAQQGFPCPAHFNPADHFLDVCSMVSDDEKPIVIALAGITIH